MIVSSETISARRFRFTLRTLLDATTLVAIVIALVLAYRQSHENELLRQENARLRNELGDEDKLHIIGVPSAESMLWKWRVYVPTGRHFYLYAGAGDLPADDGRPKSFSKLGLLPGEQTVLVKLRKNYDNQWSWYAEAGEASTEFSAEGPDLDKLLDAGNFNSTSSQTSALTKVRPGRDQQLFRLRILPLTKQGVDSSKLNTAGPGAELWISEH